MSTIHKEFGTYEAAFAYQCSLIKDTDHLTVCESRAVNDPRPRFIVRTARPEEEGDAWLVQDIVRGAYAQKEVVR